MRYPETVVRLRAPLVADRYGHDVRDWDTAAELTITQVQVQPSVSDEPVEVGRTSVVTQMRMLTPIGVDLDALPSDRFRWSGVVWSVDGEVARHKSPATGAVHHVEVMLCRVAG